MKDKQRDVPEKLREQIKRMIEFASKNVKKSEYIDPYVGSEVSAHYGHSHLAFCLLFSGDYFKNSEHEELGKALLRRIVDNWDKWSIEKDFHHDFNNFALSLCLDYLKNDSALSLAIQKTLLKSSDSSHNTINWLPMRLYVNIQRNKISHNGRYKRVNDSLSKKINNAINSDGGIEDLLPNHLSYNLQYNISTLALLQFLNINTEYNQDLTKELVFLISKKLPDNDINYVGRGSNQLFGWGPWIYLLSTSNQIDLLEEALEFIDKHLSFDGGLKSVFLNIESSVRNLHWDYHYPSVYLAHLSLWSCLALRDLKKNELDTSLNVSGLEETGLKQVTCHGSGYVTFSGRTKYLAERGPSICALYFAEIGTFFKGSIGPWPGQFGDYNFSPLNHYLHFGVLELSLNFFNSSKLFRRAWSILPKSFSYRIQPLFVLSKIEIVDHRTFEIFFELKRRRKKQYILNVPIFQRFKELIKLELFTENETINYSSEIIMFNQYESLKVYQFKIRESYRLKLRISHG